MKSIRPKCLWCGNYKNPIILLYNNMSDNSPIPPDGTIIDNEPCPSCIEDFNSALQKGGNLIFEVGTKEEVGDLSILGSIAGNDSFYYTGRMVAVTDEVIDRITKYIKVMSEELYSNAKISSKQMLDTIEEAKIRADYTKNNHKICMGKQLFTLFFGNYLSKKREDVKDEQGYSKNVE